MSSQPERTAQVFLAEDNPADVYLVRRALEEHGVAYQLQLAKNGQEALTYFQDERTRLHPDLILLDLNLPRQDGKEVLRHIRQYEDMANIPIVIMTSSDSPKDKIAVNELGATRYIRKPSDLEEFLAIGAILKDLLTKGVPATGHP